LSASLPSFQATVEKLIRRFESDQTHYLSKSYSEAQARVDFISPFFKALGWDVENEEGLAHHAREVVVEAGEDTRGRPDYGFRVSGQTKFFVEAKAPSEELDTAKHILQAKTYAWNTKQVFFVVLTDFEEFRFYDASIQPDVRKPDEGLLLKLRCADYIASLSKLWEFSKERVLAGSLEAMLPRDRRTQRLRIPVDTAFLDEMTGWREELAKNVYKNNSGLTARQLNEIVQRLLDRIVFIRIAEDRRVIEKNQLRDVVEEWKARGGKFHIFEWLNDLFNRINEDFNGEIFKPHLSEEIKIDSEVLAGIIERLYPPKSPYRFDVIGVELLGSIYERYLGKTIRPTAKQVRVEEKPEVRKAGGVYYTPKYIVDYIVKNTVGKIIEGKTPKQIEKIRILDSACGSGSFLIGAFQCLIDYHVRYLSDHPKEAQAHALFPDIIKDQNGEPRLSVVRKAEILKNNLFGVDIDPQAVEITMMSLYLKALEGERSQLPPKQHLLPELKYNIICGNSLIGPDIYDQGTLFGDAERDRINAFDWNSDVAGFGRIMKEGGFDCVIGNPAYVQIENIPQLERDYFVRVYGENGKLGKRFDIYQVFVLRALSLLSPQGRLGYILPNTFLMGRSYRVLRKRICDMACVEQCVDLPQGVFQGVTVDNVLLFLRREQGAKKRTTHEIQVHKLAPNSDKTRVESQNWDESFKIIQGSLAAPGDYSLNIHTNPQQAALFRKLEAGSVRLGDVTESSQGIILYRTEAQAQKSKHTGTKLKAGWKKLLRGTNIGRYETKWNGEYVHYGPWLWCPREEKFFTGPKILLQALRNKSLKRRLIATYDAENHYNAHNLANIIAKEASGYDLLYVLGCFNSTLLNYWYKAHFPNVNINPNDFRQLPIGRIDLNEPADRAQHDKIVALVERMLQLNKKKHSGKLAPSELERLEREIAATDAEIDNFVYELYGITDEERKIIEGR
jgi:type I restriction-modification system DNA methylase subunit